MNKKPEEKSVIWWKDKKLLAGFVLVLLSLIIGFYGKFLFIVKFYEPVGLITGISIYVFSWILFFAGVFLVGWETVKIMHQRIHHHVKETAKKAYHHAKEWPRKGYHYTRELHRKGIERIKKSIQK